MPLFTARLEEGGMVKCSLRRSACAGGEVSNFVLLHVGA